MILFILVAAIALWFGIRAIPKSTDHRRADWFERRMEDLDDDRT